jgi:glycosyltransferase involved in cell wall biosynthesis
VIPQLGVDTEVFQPRDGSDLRRQLGLHHDALVVGFGARLVRERTHLLLQAVARLEGKWQLLLMGKGPEQDQLLQLANALGISDRIRWVDTVPHLEVAHYLNAMDVCVSASISTPAGRNSLV